MTPRNLLAAVTACIAAITAAYVAPLGAGAAVPKPNGQFEIHDHETTGKNWHVQVEVSSTSKSLRTFVLYVEQCGQTVFVKSVPLAPDGSFSITRDLATSGGKGPGTWTVSGQFVTPTRLTGAYTMVSGSCAPAAQPFDSALAGHDHGHEHGLHQGSGTPIGEYPDLSKATARRRAEARLLWRRTLASAAKLDLRSYDHARAAGYVAQQFKHFRPPSLLHLRKGAYDADGHVLDAQRPESLVFWMPVSGTPKLVAYMYRAPLKQTPTLAMPLLGWHSHTTKSGRRGKTQMTHVWFTGGLGTAVANCMPVPSLEAAIPGFHYVTPSRPPVHGSAPCPQR